MHYSLNRFCTYGFRKHSLNSSHSFKSHEIFATVLYFDVKEKPRCFSNKNAIYFAYSSLSTFCMHL